MARVGLSLSLCCIGTTTAGARSARFRVDGPARRSFKNSLAGCNRPAPTPLSHSPNSAVRRTNLGNLEFGVSTSLACNDAADAFCSPQNLAFNDAWITDACNFSIGSCVSALVLHGGEEIEKKNSKAHKECFFSSLNKITASYNIKISKLRKKFTIVYLCKCDCMSLVLNGGILPLYMRLLHFFTIVSVKDLAA